MPTVVVFLLLGDLEDETEDENLDIEETAKKSSKTKKGKGITPETSTTTLKEQKYLRCRTKARNNFKWTWSRVLLKGERVPQERGTFQTFENKFKM